MDNFIDGFSKLKYNVRVVGYYLALCPNEYVQIYAHTFRERFGLKDKDYNAAVKELDKLGLLESRGWYNPSCTMLRHCKIRVFRYMFLNDSDVYRIFVSVFQKNDNIKQQLALLRYAFSGKDEPFAGSFDRNLLGSLFPYGNEPWVWRLMKYTKPDDRLWFVDNLFYWSTITGELLTREAVDAVCLTQGLSHTDAEEVDGLKTMYLYLGYGDYNVTRLALTRSPWTITTAAMREVLAGNYDEAIDLYNSAFKIFNRGTSRKNVFVDLFPQYFLVMAYIHRDDSVSTTKLATFVNKKDIADYVSLLPARYLARTYLNGNKVPNDMTIRQMSVQTYGAGMAGNVQLMAQLFDRYFQIGSLSSVAVAKPQFAVMRHEMRDYLDLSDSERAELTRLYGDKPALTSIYRKANWELLIDDVIKSANLDSDTVMPLQEALPSVRIVYARNHDGTFDPKCQTRTKKGAWSKPKNVAKSRFYNLSAEGMDDTDKIIAKIMAPSQFSYSEHNLAEDFMPYLTGTDRVMRSVNRLDYEPVEVVGEQPYISVERSKTTLGYHVDSNVTLESLRKVVNGCVTIKKDADTYLVIPVSDSQRKVFERLLSSPSFPKEAKFALQKFLTRLDDVVDIRSSLLEDSAAENAEGNTSIAVKIEPSTGMTYTVGLYAKPLLSGAAYCVPGTGKPVVYVSEGDTNYRVKRDLKAEEANYREIVDILDTPEHPMGDDEMVTVVEPEMLLDLLEYVRQNPGKATVEWPAGKAVVLRTPLSQGSWSVGLKHNHGWFDLEGEVRVDDSTVVKMSRLLELIAQEKGRFIRLGENDFVEIDKKLRRQLERLEALAVKNRNKLQISSLNAAQLDDAALESAFRVEVDDSLSKLQQRIKDSEAETPRVPKTLQATLRPYQTEGFQWMMRLASWGAGACLADDMGLGKTVQTIAFLLAKAKEGPALIVAPASVVPNWRNELERFAPTLNVQILNRADDRSAAIKDAKKGDVIISTYGLLNTQEEDLTAKKWATVCLDEAHTIKNRDTKMSKVAMELKSKYKIALTGTPIQNHLGELWNLFNFINPGLLGSFDLFRQKYANPISLNNDKDRRRALQRIIKPFMLRRTKTEVIDDLPEKTDIVLPVELTDSELALYEAMRKKAVETLEQAKSLDVNTLAEITKLRRAACSVSLIDKDWVGTSSKVQAFLDLVRDFKGDNNRMLVFSQFTSFLDIVRAALDEAGEKYLYLDGSTTMKQREKLVEEFQLGDCPLFLISLKAGGLGLNLTGANYVVHLDPWWNPAIEQQATDRSYRIGQHRNVTVYHLLAKNTIEEKIQRLHQTKRDLADSLLEGTDMAGRLTVADVLSLVSE